MESEDNPRQALADRGFAGVTVEEITEREAPLPIPASLPVFMYQGVPVADSRDVAPFAGKEHKNLLRDIRRYVKVIERLAEGQNGQDTELKNELSGKSTGSNLSSLDFFIPATYTDPTGRELPCFYCTEKGCAMIANKTPSDRGIIFTALFVDAFFEMRTRLASGTAWDSPEPDEVPALDSKRGVGAYAAGRNVTEAQMLEARRRAALDDERHRARLRELADQLAADMSSFSWWKGE